MNDTSESKMEPENSELAIPENTATLRYSDATDFVVVAKLRAKLELLVELQKTLSKTAAQHVLAVLENSIRMGWCLIDIKAEMRGHFSQFAENNLPFSKDKAERLMKAARNFQRDNENSEFIQSVQSAALEYSYSEKPLVEQVRETGARHFQDLLVTSGIAPAKQISDPSQRITIAGFFKLVRAIDAAVARLVRYQRESAVENWSQENCEIIKRKLQPLVDFWKVNLE